MTALTWGHNDKRLFVATGNQVKSFIYFQDSMCHKVHALLFNRLLLMPSTLILLSCLWCTGSPKYSRSFYLRFCLFTIKEIISKFRIRRLSLACLLFLIVFFHQIQLYFEPYSASSLVAISEFAVFCQNVSTANYEGRLYTNQTDLVVHMIFK